MTSRSCRSCAAALTEENNQPRMGRYCRTCHADKHRASSKAHYERTKESRKAAMRAYAASVGPAKRLYDSAKYRALRKGVPFSISVEDITVPDVCPVLGIPLALSPADAASMDNQPSLDRIVPSMGYVKGNIAVISFRANAIKRNATPCEVLKVYQWMASVTPPG